MLDGVEEKKEKVKKNKKEKKSNKSSHHGSSHHGHSKHKDTPEKEKPEKKLEPMASTHAQIPSMSSLEALEDPLPSQPPAEGGLLARTKGLFNQFGNALVESSDTGGKIVNDVTKKPLMPVGETNKPKP